jgi:hypothetical protein
LRQKRELLAAIPERGERRGWHRQMESLNRSIAKPLQEFRQELRGELASMRLDAASHAVLTSREHPFCVFPLEHLTDTYRRLLA